MRKLKFRVWDRGTYHYDTDNYYLDLDGSIRCKYGKEHQLDIENWTIQQYTGLKDKKGKEIYEGDIVKIHPWNSHKKELENYLCKSLKQIKWGLDVNGQYPTVGFVAINLDPADLEDGHQLNWMDASNIEVVGNIFENSELLKQ